MFEKLVEERIQEAIKNGEFDNLPFGKPINLDYWASLPEDMRMGAMLLKNAGYAPEEVQLLKEIEELRVRLADSDRDDSNRNDEKAATIKKLRETELKYHLITELRMRNRKK